VVETEVEVFGDERPRLLGLAYRMLGTRADAEDVVQDAWLRWQRADRAGIDRPAAWLTTVVSRLALDLLRARQRDRADYVGPWLPEPVPTGAAPGEDPAELAVRTESLTLGFVHVLERLNPRERAAFVLADVFDEPFRDIAGILGETESNCRQLASRARRKVVDPDAPARRSASTAEVSGALDAFLAASAGGDLDALLAVLAPDVVALSDGGAARHAARRPVVGAHRVSRFVLGVAHRLPIDAIVVLTELNGRPALVVRRATEVLLSISLEVRDGRIRRLYLVVNPDKLHQLDLPFLAC
jgi:RNA polymerase sigma-70 factor (ECF subfamily)